MRTSPTEKRTPKKKDIYNFTDERPPAEDWGDEIVVV
jgi:hypothetical protein